MPSTDLEFQPTPEDLKILREWLAKTPHIVQDYDDEFLAAFVRGSKGSLQKTKTCLESFNALGMKYPSFFGHFNYFDPIFQEHLGVMRLFPLPKRTKNGSIVFFTAMHPAGNIDPYKVHFFETIRYWLITMFIYLWENRVGSVKIMLFVDWKNCGITHARDVTPSVLKSLFEILETGLPFRMQGIHFVNLPVLLEWVLNLIKSLAKKKLANRIMFHSNLKNVYEIIDREILPKEYGGDDEDMTTLHERWKKKVESYSNRLMEESLKMRKLDHLRPKLEDEEEMIGTFKSLNVD